MKKGQPGLNPAGKPVGGKSYGKVQLRQMIYEHGDEQVNVAVDLAKAGNVAVLLALQNKMLTGLRAVSIGADTSPGNPAADGQAGLPVEALNEIPSKGYSLLG